MNMLACNFLYIHNNDFDCVHYHFQLCLHKKCISKFKFQEIDFLTRHNLKI